MHPDIQKLEPYSRADHRFGSFDKVLPFKELYQTGHGTWMWLVYCCKCRSFTKMLGTTLKLGDPKVCSDCRKKELNR